MKVFAKPLIVVSLIAVALTVSACNTTKGLGRDMENAGEGIQRSAERNGAD